MNRTFASLLVLFLTLSWKAQTGALALGDNPTDGTATSAAVAAQAN